MAGKAQYVTLGVAGETYAVPIEKVQEILEMRRIVRLPRSPSTMLGVIDVRNQGVPVVDLAAALDLSGRPDDDATRIIVLRLELDGRQRVIGLRTDRVFEVTVLDDEALEPATLSGQDSPTLVLAGLGRRNGAFVSVLDVDRLIGEQDLSWLASEAVRGAAGRNAASGAIDAGGVAA